MILEVPTQSISQLYIFSAELALVNMFLLYMRGPSWGKEISWLGYDALEDTEDEKLTCAIPHLNTDFKLWF